VAVAAILYDYVLPNSRFRVPTFTIAPFELAAQACRKSLLVVAERVGATICDSDDVVRLWALLLSILNAEAVMSKVLVRRKYQWLFSMSTRRRPGESATASRA
jgi:hypothetical protein